MKKILALSLSLIKKIISNSDLKEHFQKDGQDFLQSLQIDDP